MCDFFYVLKPYIIAYIIPIYKLLYIGIFFSNDVYYAVVSTLSELLNLLMLVCRQMYYVPGRLPVLCVWLRGT
jgi:hypothetical protein